jgi:hypothetical protein
MQFQKSLKPVILTKAIKMRPYTEVKLSKRLQPLPGLSSVVLQLQGPKEFVITIRTEKRSSEGIRLTGGERFPLQIDEDIFNELQLYSSIDHPDYRLNFDLKGKAWRDHIREHDKLTEEARKTMWIYLVVMQIVNKKIKDE